jgi:beta-galactosidase
VPFALQESASLWDTLPDSTHTENTPTMEDLNQAYGYILYRTTLPEPVDGELVLNGLHDYAQVYLNGTLAGVLDRRIATDRMPLHVTTANTRLDLLVENTGRVNFTVVLRGERKGLTGQVTLAGKPLTGWDVFSLPMQNTSGLSYKHQACKGPCFYRADFQVDKPADTFLDTGKFVKGEVWLNGRPLGRIWDIGPQRALYLPGPWLKTGANQVVVFDLDGGPGRSLQGLDHPRLAN